jgi:hypothetical protein
LAGAGFAILGAVVGGVVGSRQPGGLPGASRAEDVAHPGSSKVTRWLGASCGAALACTLTYAVLPEGKRFAVRHLWGRSAGWMLHSASFWVLLVAAVVGALTGHRLERLRGALLTNATWGAWYRQHRRTSIIVSGLGAVAVIALTIAAWPKDKAEEGFRKCEQLEERGRLEDALTACNAAHDVDPETESGKRALSKAMDIQRTLDEVVPVTVTREWCGRLRSRLERRLSADAQLKYGGAGGDVGRVIHDNVLGVEYFCRQAVGQPTAGFWTCRWNETLDNYKDCDALER